MFSMVAYQTENKHGNQSKMRSAVKKVFQRMHGGISENIESGWISGP